MTIRRTAVLGVILGAILLTAVPALGQDLTTRLSNFLYNVLARVGFDADAADILAIRNGTTNQTVRIYSTFTNSTNYERLSLVGDSGNTRVQLAAETAGTGSDNLDVRLAPAGAGAVLVASDYLNVDTIELVQAVAPTISSCGDGALATGSTDTVGRVTGTTQTACTITFSSALGANSADCIMENLTANRGNITAASTTAMTVSNLTAGDDFMYICLGR